VETTTKSQIEVTLVQGSKLKETFEIPEGVTVATDDGDLTGFDRMFRILSQEKGDERLVWNSRSLVDIQGAKKMFIEFVKKGLKPFRVGIDGKATSEVMREFDPLAEEVIFMPMALVVGG
jgi:hypothetical protein